MKKLINLLLLFMVVFTLSACGGNDSSSTSTNSNSSNEETEGKTYTFKLGHEAQGTHVKFAVAEKFKTELESRSDGRMKVEIYPANQLGNEKDMVQQLETGTLDFGIISNGTMSSRSESLNGWFMPFLFETLEEAGKARETEAAKEMLTELEKQGLVGFDVFFAGYRHMLSKSKEIKSISEIEGVKIRIPGSPVFEDFWKLVGAGPTPMPLPEVYTSIQTGVIEAVDADLDALLSQKWYEAAKNLTLTNHIAFAEIILGSKTVFYGLSKEDQQIVKEAWKAAADWGVAEGIRLENKRIEEIKEKGVKVTQLANTKEFDSIKTEIYNKYSENPVIKAFIEQNQK